MSGGSMDYLCGRVTDATFREHTPLRQAFREHLNLVAKALHDIEWVDSCDYGEGDEEDAILVVLGHGGLEKLTGEEAIKARIRAADTRLENIDKQRAEVLSERNRAATELARLLGSIK